MHLKKDLLGVGVSIYDDYHIATNLLQRPCWPLVEQGGALTCLEVGGECESGSVERGEPQLYTIPLKEQLDKPQAPSPQSH